MKAGLFKPIPILAFSLFIALLLAACHHKEAPKPIAAPQVAKNPDEPTKQIPPDLYKLMPIYPGAVVTHVRKPKGAMREILFRLDNSPSLNTMVSFYKDGLKKADFRITSSLIMPARKTWSCDFHKLGRPGSVMLYPDDNDKTATVIDVIYEMPSKNEEALLEPREDFDVIGPGKVAGETSNVKVKRN